MDNIWTTNYQPGIAQTINPDKYPSLVTIFTEACARYARLPAYANFGKNLSYKELQENATHFAAYLQNQFKLSKGDRVAVMLPNILQYPVVVFGILSAGLTVVNVNPLYTVPELTKQLTDSSAKTIIVLENFAYSIQKVMEHIQLDNIIITQIGDLLGNVRGTITNYIVKYVKKMVPDYTIASYTKFRDVIKIGKTQVLLDPNIQGKDIAFLQYTGGTTGVAKGAMLTHRNMVANLEQIYEWTKYIVKDSSEIVITALPMYHIFSLTVNCLAFIKRGALNVLITNPRDTDSLIKEIAKYKFTVITGVNTLYNSLLNSVKFKQLDFSTLKLSIGGGMAVQRAVAEKWYQITGKVLMEGYGLTEASPVVCMNPLNLAEYNGTIGIPLPSTDVSIRDNMEKELGVGEIGELWVRGPQVMVGYWKQEVETAAVLTKDEWLKTGDIASINPDGYIKIVDRKKDVIIISGFNVYPNEVEDVIALLDGVKEVAVIGIPAPQGERIKAIIVKSREELTEKEVIGHCHNYLAAYKIPKIIEFRVELPKTNVGKILKRALK
jgi:long-chain acyl-CoA synthetase